MSMALDMTLGLWHVNWASFMDLNSGVGLGRVIGIDIGGDLGVT